MRGTEKGLQIALKVNEAQVIGICRIPFELATTAKGDIAQEVFRLNFTQFINSGQIRVPGAKIADHADLSIRKVFVVGRNQLKLYFSFALPSEDVFVAEVVEEGDALNIEVKANTSQLVLADAVGLFAAS
jgi:hypothetical protein